MHSGNTPLETPVLLLIHAIIHSSDGAAAGQCIKILQHCCCCWRARRLPISWDFSGCLLNAVWKPSPTSKQMNYRSRGPHVVPLLSVRNTHVRLPVVDCVVVWWNFSFHRDKVNVGHEAWICGSDLPRVAQHQPIASECLRLCDNCCCMFSVLQPVMWCNRVNMEQNLKGVFPTACGITGTENWRWTPPQPVGKEKEEQ